MTFPKAKNNGLRTVSFRGRKLFSYLAWPKTALKPLIPRIGFRPFQVFIRLFPTAARNFVFYGFLWARGGLARRLTGQTASKDNRLAVLFVMDVGGVGDILISLAWLKEFYKQSPADVRLDALFLSRNSSHLLESVKASGLVDNLFTPDSAEKLPGGGYHVIMASAVNYCCPIYRDDRRLKPHPEMERLLDKLSDFFIRHRQYFDYGRLTALYYAWSAYGVLRGCNRWDDFGASGALEFSRFTKGLYYLFPESQAVFEKFQLKPGQYLTVHAGFDYSGGDKIKKSTKIWPRENWAEFIRLFKRKYPHLTVVQLGAPNSYEIEGVDLRLIGRTTFQEAAAILKLAWLHIDGESGLVSLRHIFGGRSLVMFGPSSAGYCGYEENLNLTPPFCGNCMWMADDWAVNCVRGFDPPECLKRLEPRFVLAALEERFGGGPTLAAAPTLERAEFYSSARYESLKPIVADIFRECGLKEPEPAAPHKAAYSQSGVHVYPRQTWEYAFVAENLSQLLAGPKPPSVAVVGGGRGALPWYLARKGYKTTVYDWNFKAGLHHEPSFEQDYFRLARKSGFEAEFASPLNLPVASHSYDAVASAALSDDLEYQEFVIRELLRILKPGGRLILTYGAKINPPGQSAGESLKALDEALRKAGAPVDRWPFEPSEPQASWRDIERDRMDPEFKAAWLSLVIKKPAEKI